MPVNVVVVVSPEEAADFRLWTPIAVSKSGIPKSDCGAAVIRKRSIDARSRNVKIQLSVDIYKIDEPQSDNRHTPQLNQVADAEPVVIVGCGPAGIFAALKLIELGYKPIIVERGKSVRERRRDLALINRERTVNPDSNYCFGEGGAGTYSDGKLYTRSGKRGDINRVLDTFIHFGASDEIGIDSHPHIGTNKLPGIISGMREAILQCGGEIHFNTRFCGIERSSKGIDSVNYRSTTGSGQIEKIRTRAVILATGHSARDIFEYLHQEKILIEAKPFALGVRIEHPQEVIDQIRYHCDTRSPFLPPASYALVEQAAGRGVYSFCMCPGGIIASAATAPGEIVVNGWSPSKRNNPFANSGMVVSVGEADFKPFAKDGALMALRFQKSIEQKAFQAGGSDLTAPAQRLMDFLDHRPSSSLPPCSYAPGLKSQSIDQVLTAGIALSLREGLKHAGKKMKGYLTNEAVLVAAESRTSSPVRIPRDNDTHMHPEVAGLFPCGEGAGYAGGIMSAAMDGEKVATAVTHFLQNTKRS